MQRNVGNLATHKDPNCMACLEYTVDHLKVKHVLVVGHYNCGAAARSALLPSAGTCAHSSCLARGPVCQAPGGLAAPLFGAYMFASALQRRAPC